MLNGELARIQEFSLVENGFTVHVIMRVIERKVSGFKEPVILGPSRLPIYRKLPWLGR